MDCWMCQWYRRTKAKHFDALTKLGTPLYGVKGHPLPQTAYSLKGKTDQVGVRSEWAG